MLGILSLVQNNVLIISAQQKKRCEMMTLSTMFCDGVRAWTPSKVNSTHFVRRIS